MLTWIPECLSNPTGHNLLLEMSLLFFGYCPHRSLLGQIQPVLFIHDSSQMILFADDCASYNTIQSVDDCSNDSIIKSSLVNGPVIGHALTAY